ncbi:hypothetical protein SRB5_38080 [Streptomyces sp. RB5]|uniref:vWA-MoxR associated protein C-terminal domain-containing protein n=2 Tax=Streptomyces smaragdinus TaxID=2585196 RepID=A0A7K0CJL7_9ACTN|nr:hypothetical protein [Streptomyces smaragdinus]
MRLLDDPVRRAVVRIGAPADGYDAPGGSFWGTGFFIAPRLVLTCAHVVAKGLGAVWEGARAIGVVTDGGRRLAGTLLYGLPRPRDPGRPPLTSWPMPDLALISVPAATDDDGCLWLADRYSGPDDRIRWYGWSGDAVSQGPVFLSGSGTLTGSRDMPHVLRVTSGSSLYHGVSGGPVLDERTGAVIAVVKATGKDSSGLATPVTGLRALCDQGPRAAAQWHGAVAAHDRYHYRRYARGGDSWPRLQRRLAEERAETVTGLGPHERAQLYALFAELPPPGCAGDVLELVRLARGEVLRPPYDINDHNPRSWRDGAALLRTPRDSSAEAARFALEAVTVYAALVYDWVRATTADPSARVLTGLRAWTERFVPRLDNEVIQERIPAILDGARRPAGAHADVLVEIEAEPGDNAYGWRVKLLDPRGKVVSTQMSARPAPRERLEDELRAALRLQLSKGDLGPARACVDFMLPRELFGEPVDRWTPRHPDPGEPPGPQTGPLGRHRLVALRDFERRAHGPYEQWRSRWDRITAGPLLPFVPPDPVAEQSNGAGAPVPVDAGGVSGGEGARRLAELLDGGHPAALCVRAELPGGAGEEFHREARALVSASGDGAGLRAGACAARGAEHPAAWARDLVLLYDPPDRPPLPSDDLFEPLLPWNES